MVAIDESVGKRPSEGQVLRRARAHLATLAALLFASTTAPPSSDLSPVGGTNGQWKHLTTALRFAGHALASAAEAEARTPGPLQSIATRVALAAVLVAGIAVAARTDGQGLAGAPHVLAGESSPTATAASGAGGDSSTTQESGSEGASASSSDAPVQPAVLLAVAARASDSVASSLRLLLAPLPAPEGMMAQRTAGHGGPRPDGAAGSHTEMLLAIRQPAVALPAALVAAAHEAARAIGTGHAAALGAGLEWALSGAGLGRRAAPGAVLEMLRPARPAVEVDGEVVLVDDQGKQVTQSLAR